MKTIHDGIPYSAEETAPALPMTGPLNWGGGEPHVSPPYVPAEQCAGLTSAPSVRGHGELFGVNAIAGGSE